MHTSSLRPAAAGVALAALLSACTAETASPPSLANVTSTTTESLKEDVDNGGGDVNCSTHGGKVGPEGGKQVDLIAESTKAGRVGCADAFTVITEYYLDAPTRAEGTARFLRVREWACMADTGAHGSGRIGCEKDGLAFHTE